MRYLIAILIMCLTSTVVGEDIFKPTGRYAEKSVISSVAAPHLPDYVVMVKVRNCGPCERMELNEVPILRQHGVQVLVLDSDNLPPGMVWRHAAGPSIAIIDGKTRKSRKDWLGYTAASVILKEMVVKETVLVTPDNGKSVVILEKTNRPDRFGFSTKSSVQPVAGRYVGYGGMTYDMETWSRMCSMRNCGMCNFLDGKKAEYERNKTLSYQSVEIEVPSPQSSSPDDVVNEAIPIMNLTPSDVVGELGSGDGMPAIKMVQASGCRVIGVEIDPEKVTESRRNVEAAGLSDRITIIQGDVRDFNPTAYGVTAIYAYLYPELLNEIKPILSAGRICVCPGHKADGLGMTLVGQCWVRKNNS